MSLFLLTFGATNLLARGVPDPTTSSCNFPDSIPAIPGPVTVSATVRDAFESPVVDCLTSTAIVVESGSLDPGQQLVATGLTDASGFVEMTFPDGIVGLATIHLDISAECPTEILLCSSDSYLVECLDLLRVRDDGTGDVPTIQEAVEAVCEGGTVLVEAGIYTGWGNRDIDLQGKNVGIISESGPEVTVIDCEGSGRGFLFQSGESPDAKVSGLTIKNGLADMGGAIKCTNASSPTIQGCNLTQNHASMGRGGAIYCEGGSDAVLEDCEIHGNTVDGGSTTLDGGGGIACLGSSPIISGCTIVGNGTDSDGGGIHCANGSSAQITDCLVAGNHSLGNAGGINVDFLSSAPSITGCTVADNHAGAYGGGLLVGTALLDVARTIIWGNCSGAGGDEVEALATTFFICCDVDSSGVEDFGGVAYPQTLFLDPGFCSPSGCEGAPSETGDYGLQSISPCLPESSPCGQQIGARGQACELRYPRTVVAETWTNTGCMPCAHSDSLFDGWLLSRPDIPTVRHHVWFPQPNDPFYLVDPEAQRNRFDYYDLFGITTVNLDGPHSVMDPNDSTTYTALYDERRSIPSRVAIQLSASYDGAMHAGDVDVRVIAAEEMSEDWHLRIAVTESNIEFSAPNGTLIHNYIFRSFVPDTAGTVLEFAPPFPDTVDVSIPYNLAPEWNAGNVTLVAFLQDDVSLGIEQGADFDLSSIVTAVGGPGVTSGFELQAVSPNPFHPPVLIRFDLAQPSRIDLSIFDTAGRLVKTVAEGFYPAGHHVSNWDGRDVSNQPVAAGVYYYKLRAGGHESSAKSILLR